MKISVLIPCHNAARYLGEAIESALSQGLDLHEVIVVDDGSTDGSDEVARSFGARVRCRSQARTGISGARNATLEAATGDVIAFLDADDLWPPCSLLRRHNALVEDESPDYAYGVVEQFVSPDTSEEIARIHAAQAGTASPARMAGAMLIRRRVFDRIGGFDTSLKVGETIDWVARADADGALGQAVPDVVLRRRLHATNSGILMRDSRTDYLAVARAALLRRRGAAATG